MQPIRIDVSNSTHDVCLLNAYQQLKGLNFFTANREGKLNAIQENLECALEKYGPDAKIEKHTNEDQWTRLERTIKSLISHSFSFFTNSSQEKQTQKVDVSTFSLNVK
jgi:hypothetical protein